MHLDTWVLLPGMILWELAFQVCLPLRPNAPQAAPACPIPNLWASPGNRALGGSPSRGATWNSR